ncbi:hypothetical protein Purlil1_13868 [Purpureocillium lilacinum]|uniref:Trypsin-like peptidase domain-containing protein n=1 Tax=Purpureocillium lilacinum TaxID=33203 RepID=A0ABR0BD71_PURLI|nr:hypothetical protein Purlil1_13868 [Purpureocillium lilacinum]
MGERQFVSSCSANTPGSTGKACDKFAVSPPVSSYPSLDVPGLFERIARNVVRLEVSFPASFDLQRQTSGNATGFVVDKALGLILTNRHVVGPGPFWGHAVFYDERVVRCYPRYYDPVHDFGFLQYDPQVLGDLHVDGLDLSPDQAGGMTCLALAETP